MKQELRIEDRALVTRRRFAYGVDRVWTMWTEARYLEKWWGPAGFTTETSQFTFAIGGHWTFEMIGPDGVRYPNDLEFTLLERPHRLTIAHLGQPRFEIRVELIAAGPGATDLTFTQVFETQEARDAVRVYAEPANEQIMDKLNGLLGA